MPTKDEPRLTLRLSSELDASLRERAAGEGVKPGTWARQTLEAALGSAPEAGTSGSRSSPGSASPRASSPEAEVLRKVVEVQHRMVTPPMFKCPMPGCDYRVKSPAARCGPHGRTVVPE